jgi:hypothetical protein
MTTPNQSCKKCGCQVAPGYDICPKEGVINLLGLMRVKFKPCYPSWYSRADQIEHIGQEHDEVREARNKGNWEHLASEYLDLAQTC